MTDAEFRKRRDVQIETVSREKRLPYLSIRTGCCAVCEMDLDHAPAVRFDARQEDCGLSRFTGTHAVAVCEPCVVLIAKAAGVWEAEGVTHDAPKVVAEIIEAHRDHVEAMACAWLKKTGLDPSAVQIVERWEGMTLTISIERREIRVCDHPCEKCPRVPTGDD